MRQGIVTLIAAITLFSSSIGSAAAAGNGTTLTTSPLLLNLTVKPGSSVTKTLQLMNNGSQPVGINMGIKEFGSDNATGTPKITNLPANDPVNKYVSFSPSTFTAQPGVWSKVDVKISLPTTAQLGYYLAIIFQPVVPQGAKTAPLTAQYQGSNAVLVLIDTQSGNEQRTIDVSHFTVSKHVYNYLPATFSVTLHNSGNIYVAPYGEVAISRRSDLSDTLATIPVNKYSGNVLPNSSRTFQAEWSDGFPVYQTKMAGNQPVLDKKGQPEQHLQWDFSKANHLRFGKYYAKLTLVYNNGQRPVPISSVVSFWVIPWKILIIIGLIVLIFVAGVVSLLRGLLRRRNASTGGYKRR